MLKSALLLFFRYLLIPSAFSQVKTSGKIIYEIKTHANQKELITAKLFFSDSSSLFVYNKIGYDSIQPGKSIHTSSNAAKNINGISMFSSGISESGNMIYRNFNKNQILLKENLPFLDDYTVLDHWLPIKWEKTEEQKNILGYNSLKAIGKFRGREYIAWYTTEIPLPYGPAKLFGLPGIILEAYSVSPKNLKPDIVFKVKNLCYPCEKMKEDNKEPMISESIPMEKFVFIKDHSTELIALKFNQITKENIHGSFVKNKTPSTKKTIKKARLQNMEIQYEWENYPGDTENPFDEDFRTLMKQINDTTDIPEIKKSIKKNPKKAYKPIDK